jgi:hypothetical protein
MSDACGRTIRKSKGLDSLYVPVPQGFTAHVLRHHRRLSMLRVKLIMCAIN